MWKIWTKWATTLSRAAQWTSRQILTTLDGLLTPCPSHWCQAWSKRCSDKKYSQLAKRSSQKPQWKISWIPIKKSSSLKQAIYAKVKRFESSSSKSQSVGTSNQVMVRAFLHTAATWQRAPRRAYYIFSRRKLWMKQQTLTQSLADRPTSWKWTSIEVGKQAHQAPQPPFTWGQWLTITWWRKFRTRCFGNLCKKPISRREPL